MKVSINKYDYIEVKIEHPQARRDWKYKTRIFDLFNIATSQELRRELFLHEAFDNFDSDKFIIQEEVKVVDYIGLPDYFSATYQKELSEIDAVFPYKPYYSGTVYSKVMVEKVVKGTLLSMVSFVDKKDKHSYDFVEFSRQDGDYHLKESIDHDLLIKCIINTENECIDKECGEFEIEDDYIFIAEDEEEYVFMMEAYSKVYYENRGLANDMLKNSINDMQECIDHGIFVKVFDV